MRVVLIVIATLLLETESSVLAPSFNDPMSIGSAVASSFDSIDCMDLRFGSSSSDDEFEYELELSPDELSPDTPGPRYLDMICERIEMAGACSFAQPLIDDEKIESVARSVDQSGTVQLGPLLGASLSSRVFSIAGNPNLAIKYQSDCGERRSMHPLTREYWFLKYLEDLDVSPKVYSLSQSVVRSQTSTAKTSSLEMMADKGACMKSPDKAQFRYLIMERVGESLHSYLKRPYLGGKVSVKRAFELGIEMMALLEKVHSRGVVHGDIFQRNVCFKDDKLVLIDFGRAMLVHHAPPLARVDSEIYLFPLFSLWEMLGYRASFRDDVFRVLQLMAVLMNGSKYVDAMDLLSEIPIDSQGRQPLLVYKAAGFIFELPKAGFLPISGIESGAIRTKVHGDLKALLDYVRALGLDEMPDHKSIIAALQELVGIL